MDKELLERIALEQREYWSRIRTEAGVQEWTQDEPGRPSLSALDPSTITPADWVNYWNSFVDPAQSH